MNVRRIGVLANLEKQGVDEAHATVLDWAERHRIEVVTNRGDRDDTRPSVENPFGVSGDALAELYRDIDVLVCLGGDGTLLFAAQLVAPASVPVLSVNLGSLGFHTQVKPSELEVCLERLLLGEYVIDRRMMLQVDFAGAPISSSETGDLVTLALNDIVISKSAWGHMVTLRLAIDGRVVTDISADALIVSTPTGSSGYNFAADGPVFYPSMQGVILNALCAHRMRVSPLVVPPEAKLEVQLRPRRPQDSAQVLADGQAWHSMSDSETLKISRADVYLPLLVFNDDFYGKLREKLRWGGLF